MSQSGLTPYQDELLEILAEECAEISQEKSKIIRFGYNEMSHHIKGNTHRECLTQELGDMLAMIELIVDSDMGIAYNDIQEAKKRKLEKVGKWMTHSKPAMISSTGDVMKLAIAKARSDLNAWRGLK